MSGKTLMPRGNAKGELKRFVGTCIKKKGKAQALDQVVSIEGLAQIYDYTKWYAHAKHGSLRPCVFGLESPGDSICRC
jgi:hypothetical protein